MSQGTPSRASLLGLPPEIQNRILSYLTLSSIKSTQSLLYTCRQLYQVALPFSVHTYDNPDPDYDAEPRRRPRSRNLQFLHYISITKPELARYVKAITLGSFGSSEDDAPEGLELLGPTKEEAPIYEALIERTVTPETDSEWETARKEWLQDLSESREDAEVALLLVVCPNVEVLLFGEPYRPRNFQRLFKIASQRNTKAHDEGLEHGDLPLSHLREFYHESADTKYGYLVFHEPAAAAFRLPSLRSYECIMANGSDESGREFVLIPRGSSSVEEIYLRRSCVSPTMIFGMAGACKALRAFEYTRGVYHMYDDEMMPRDLMEAMLPHAETLEYLYINEEDDWEKQNWVESPQRIYMGVELRQMTALKTLVTGMQALTGMLDGQPEEVYNEEIPLKIEGAPRLVECIPDNLEHLEIHGCGKAILDQAQQLLDAISKAGRCPNLKKIRFLFNAEKIERETVNLTLHSPTAQLDVVFQTRHNRTYDLVTYSHLRPEGGRYPEYAHNEHICSRIYMPELREQWLKIRGSDVAMATVNGGVYKLPGVDAADYEEEEKEEEKKDEQDEDGEEGEGDEGEEGDLDWLKSDDDDEDNGDEDGEDAEDEGEKSEKSERAKGG